jgi:1-acyl-sn-glycerol-3-phosphate acyltransferase
MILARMHLMLIFTQIKAVFIAFILFVFILLPTCLIAIPFRLRRRVKIVGPVWKFCQTIVLRYACEAQVLIKEDHRSESMKDVPAKGLYIANHQSYIDIPLVTIMYQAPPIMKKEVLYIPLVGLLGWISGAMPVARSSRKSGRKVLEQTRQRLVVDNVGVQVYPEGTRSKNAHPKPFENIKRTLLNFAFNEGIPVIPTSLYGTRGVLSQKGWIMPKKKLGVIVHRELNPKDFSSADEFSRACWDQVTKGYEDLASRIAPQS